MTARRPYDLAVVGDINPDLILAAPDLQVEFGQDETLAESADLLLGGSAAIVACAAARLGLRVAMVGLVGDDSYGRFCLHALQRNGVDTAGIVTDPVVTTGLTVILQRHGDRAIVTHLGSIAALQRRHVDEALLGLARHVHASSYFLLDGLRDDLPALFDGVRSRGSTTSLDTNDDPRARFDIDAIVDRVDVLLPNEAEACRLAGTDTVDEAAAMLAKRSGLVAVTTASGAFARRGDEVVTAATKGVEPATILDAVGAGDNFNAGFLRSFLDGGDLADCLRSGLAAAAESLRWRGGTGR